MKRNIFEKRKNIKPYEYPELLSFKDAISHSYWLWSEYNFTSDIQDFKIVLSEKERTIIKKTILAISQVEVSVKRFWPNIYNYFPKTEIDLVGLTFGESECRHFEAYSKLLELLDMDDMFLNIEQYEALMKRVDYMGDFLEK